ncbi:hypothetical protein M378DRAFT_166370 [Amanita muscaria Koide BX008]|uniref:Uncharacterized protein n=1 Tax=Amanita muscaria (strain Koide BX008) TaxID=946122 RepID=A0A0C2SFM5_AMAMK|nr:hypothetical protein M378DRAFT_166370 [Amanita muscaria Koide BX008]
MTRYEHALNLHRRSLSSLKVTEQRCHNIYRLGTPALSSILAMEGIMWKKPLSDDDDEGT